MDIDKINSYVNRAQLSINDWQCSNEADYLRQAQANLGSALELERAARVAALAAEKEEIYSVGDDDEAFTPYDTPNEALESVRGDLTADEIVTVIQWRESSWHPEIDAEKLSLKISKKMRAKMATVHRSIGANASRARVWLRLVQSWSNALMLSCKTGLMNISLTLIGISRPA